MSTFLTNNHTVITADVLEDILASGILPMGALSVAAGIAPENWHGFRIGGQPLTPAGGTSYGFLADHTLPATPSNSHGFATFMRTPALAGNWGTHIGYRVGAFVLGFGSAINNIVGFQVDASTTVCSDVKGIEVQALSGGTGSNIGILVGDITGVGAFAIKTGLGPVDFGDIVLTPATTTARASIRLPHGTAPSAPVNGDMWTTTAGLFVRINGANVGPLS